MGFFCFARVVESVDTQDLKSCGSNAVRVQVPPRVRMHKKASACADLFCFEKTAKWLCTYAGLQKQKSKTASGFGLFMFETTKRDSPKATPPDQV